MKYQKSILSLVLAVTIMLSLAACGTKEPAGAAGTSEPSAVSGIAQRPNEAFDSSENRITKEMAYEGVSGYCHSAYDWSIAKDNPDIMYVEMGEESETSYRVIFRSYTGAFVYFDVDKATGTTKMTEYVPTLGVENDAGTIDLFDYLK